MGRKDGCKKLKLNILCQIILGDFYMKMLKEHFKECIRLIVRQAEIERLCVPFRDFEVQWWHPAVNGHQLCKALHRQLDLASILNPLIDNISFEVSKLESQMLRFIRDTNDTLIKTHELQQFYLGSIPIYKYFFETKSFSFDRLVMDKVIEDFVRQMTAESVEIELTYIVKNFRSDVESYSNSLFAIRKATMADVFEYHTGYFAQRPEHIISLDDYICTSKHVVDQADYGKFVYTDNLYKILNAMQIATGCGGTFSLLRQRNDSSYRHPGSSASWQQFAVSFMPNEDLTTAATLAQTETVIAAFDGLGEPEKRSLEISLRRLRFGADRIESED